MISICLLALLYVSGIAETSTIGKIPYYDASEESNRYEDESVIQLDNIPKGRFRVGIDSSNILAIEDDTSKEAVSDNQISIAKFKDSAQILDKS